MLKPGCCLYKYLWAFTFVFFLSCGGGGVREQLGECLAASHSQSTMWASLEEDKTHLHVVHPRCFFFNKRKFVAVWREKYLQKLWSSKSESTGENKSGLWNVRRYIHIRAAANDYFPCMSHPLTIPGLQCARVGADHPCCKDESCKVLAAKSAHGLEPPNLFSLLSLFSAIPGHLPGLVAHLLTQSEVLCLIQEPSKRPTLPIPFPYLPFLKPPRQFPRNISAISLLEAEGKLLFLSSLEGFSILLHVSLLLFTLCSEGYFWL